MNKFKLLTKNNLLTTIGILAGGVAGFLYWRFVGCSYRRVAPQYIPHRQKTKKQHTNINNYKPK